MMTPPQEQLFRFQPRWKEELVVTGPGGSFVIEMPMGVLSVYLPAEAAWAEKAPSWALNLWPVLRAELEDWCQKANAKLFVDEGASLSLEQNS
jgi:hypothetical protein